MIRINSILAATDLSPQAGQAIERAALLATGLGLERLELLHVLQGLSLQALRRLLPGGATEQALLDAAATQLHKAAEDIERRYQLQGLRSNGTENWAKHFRLAKVVRKNPGFNKLVL